MRLDRFISMSVGVPRKMAGAIVRSGRVQVQGEIERNCKRQVALSGEVVALDGEPLRAPGHTTLVMNKPKGCISATQSREHETVIDHVPAKWAHAKLAPVGRLDKDTTGLLLLTTDGGLSHRITHPKRKVEKAYIAGLKAPLEPGAAAVFEAGMTLADGTPCRPARLEILTDTTVRVVLTEGRFHQVKRMLGRVGGHVVTLHRERIGPLVLDPSQAPGEVQPLMPAQLVTLIDALQGVGEQTPGEK
ncbi:MAG: pseudouridine synthase [Myxococcales bacterium]|nr:pseudouridine synthase [Myxococcales bacterium]